MEIERLVDSIDVALREAAETKIDADRAERAMKRVFASVMISKHGAVELRKSLATIDGEYVRAEETYLDALYASEMSRVRADALRLKFEAWRTLESTRRAEMTLR